MGERALHDAIDALVREIDSLDPDDEAGREQLLELADTLKARLARHDESTASPGVGGSPGDNAILDMVTRYESRHPQLTAALNDIMNRLASMGI